MTANRLNKQTLNSKPHRKIQYSNEREPMKMIGKTTSEASRANKGKRSRQAREKPANFTGTLNAINKYRNDDLVSRSDYS